MTTHTTHADAARIGAAIARHLRTPKWGWRYADVDSITDAVDRRAIARLQSDAGKARRWLREASAHLGIRLPSGNGINDQWQRQAILSPDGTFGIADIAVGCIAWTDVVAPSYVRRFAPTRSDCSFAPNIAGGSGSMAAGCAQVTLTLSDRESAHIGRIPRPSVTRIVCGYRTCYGHCGTLVDGTCVTTASYLPAISAGAEVTMTTEPQWEEVDMGIGVQRAMWESFLVRQGWGSKMPDNVRSARLAGGNNSVDGETLQYVSVYGTRDERAAAAAYIREQWAAHILAEAQRAAAQAAHDLLLRNSHAGIDIRPSFDERAGDRLQVGANHQYLRAWDVLDAIRHDR
ncbi:MAG TPA: hypothetical protein VFG73_02335 [Rhodanobacteraceae bacterium]|nr:hypothetical protein [Rhodanobacteraceae bacterium]